MTKICIYEFQCKLCEDRYIGRTNGYIQTRFSAHKNAVKNNNTNTSALAEHLNSEHKDKIGKIETFKLRIITTCRRVGTAVSQLLKQKEQTTTHSTNH